MIWAYLAGLLTLPLGFVVWNAVSWARARGWGQSGCYVCEHGAVGEIGEKTNLRGWSERQWHRWYWSKRAWHKAAWRAHWAYRGKG
jgi:hypothetical protein